MRPVLSTIVAVTLSVLVTGCGGGDHGPASPVTATPVTQAPVKVNHSPVITSASIPTVAISGVTSVAFSAAATDADGDALSYTWLLDEFPSNPAASRMLMGAQQSLTMTAQRDGQTYAVSLRVNDGHGGEVTQYVNPIVVRTLTGRWRFQRTLYGSGGCNFGFDLLEMRLAQSGNAITGDVSIPAHVCANMRDRVTRVDSGARIEADGSFQMRLKDIGWDGEVGDMFLKGVVEANRITATATYQWEDGFDVLRLSPVQ